MIKKFFYNEGCVVAMIALALAIFFIAVFSGNTEQQVGVVETESEREPEKTEVVSETETNEQKYTEMTVTATAYCPCTKCCGKSDGITATGTKATAGRTIAVDPSVIPYGTEVVIGGHTYIAEDTGGVVKGNKIDVFFDNHTDALKFGVQKLTILVKE